MAWEMPPKMVTLDVEMPEPKAFDLDPAKTALVVVDMEDYFLRGETRSRLGATIAGNVTLLEKFRAAGAPVIFIQSVRKPEALEVTRFFRSPMLLEGSTDVEIAYEIAPAPGEPVVQKWSHDPWARTSLEATLDEMGINCEEWTVLVTGVSAAVCAHACALGFANRHYMTLIPMDATAAGGVEEEARVYAQYMSGAYNYCMDFTRSDLVTMTPGAPSPEVQRVSEPALT